MKTFTTSQRIRFDPEKTGSLLEVIITSGSLAIRMAGSTGTGQVISATAATQVINHHGSNVDFVVTGNVSYNLTNVMQNTPL